MYDQFMSYAHGVFVENNYYLAENATFGEIIFP